MVRGSWVRIASPMTKEHMRSGKVRRDRRGLVRPLCSQEASHWLSAWPVRCSFRLRPREPKTTRRRVSTLTRPKAFSARKFELAAREYQAAFDITKEATLLASIGGVLAARWKYRQGADGL